MTQTKVGTAQVSFYNQEFFDVVKEAAHKERITIPLLAKRALAKFLHVELPANEAVQYRPPLGKYAHIIGVNKVREQNLRNLTQYILDNWQDMPDDIKAQVIANQPSS